MDIPTLIHSYKEVERKLEDLVQKEFFEADFFQTLMRGEYTYEQIRYFAIQYSYYSRHFPRVLGAAISAMEPIDSWWIPIADNLWDEGGRGIPGRSHEKLYQTFLLTVDPDLTLNSYGMPNIPISSSVEKAIKVFIDFFRRATPLQAMAAVGLGSEIFAGGVMGLIGKGFQHPAYNKDRLIDVTFWQVHADEHEPHHYQLCKDILVKFTDVLDLQTMFEAGSQIARSEAAMYQSLHNEMLNLEQHVVK